MTTTSNRWKLGLFVTVTTTLAGFVLVWAGASRLERDSVEAKYYFDEEVSGLEVGSPVKYRGVTIGKVATIHAAPDRRHVEVTAEVFIDSLQQLGLASDDRPDGPRPGDELPDELRAQLIRSPLTGIAFVQINFFDVERHPVPEYPFDVPWNTLHTVPSTGVSIEHGLVALSDELPKLVDGATRLVERLDQLAEEAEVVQLSRKLQTVLETLDERLKGIEEAHLFERTEGALVTAEETLSELRALTSELRGPDGPLLGLASSYAELAAAVKSTLDASDLPGTTAAVRETTHSLGHTSDELDRLAEDLRRDVGTLWSALESIQELADLLERDPAALLRGKVVPANSPGETIR